MDTHNQVPKAIHLSRGATSDIKRFVIWSAFPPLCSDQSSAGAARETVYRRRPGLPGRRTHHLEQPAGQRDICPVSVNLPSAFKTFLFQASFPEIIIDPGKLFSISSGL